MQNLTSGTLGRWLAGKTSKGRALDTCCRGCAKGGEHDVRCQQDPAN